MAKVEHQIPRSNRGVFSPLLDGRTDLEFFQDSLIKCENMIPSVYGPSLKRGGSIFAYGSKDNTGCHLIPFVAGIGSSYILEFGDGYIRFYKDGAILMDDGIPYEVETPYTLAEITNTDGSLKLSYTQSIDVLDLVYEGERGYQLKRYGDTDWIFALAEYKNGPYGILNFGDENLYAKITNTSGKFNTGSVIGVNLTKLKEDCRLQTFTGTVSGVSVSYNLDEAIGWSIALAISSGRNQTATVSLNSISIGTSTIYSSSDIESVKQNITSIILSDSTISSKLINNSLVFQIFSEDVASSGQDVEIKFSDFGGDSIKATATLTSSLIPKVDTMFNDNTDRNKLLKLHLFNSNTKYWITNEAVTADLAIRYSDGKYYLAKTSATTGTQKPNHTEGIVSDGTVDWEYLHAGDGYVKMISFSSVNSEGYSHQANCSAESYVPVGILAPGSNDFNFQMGIFGIGIGPSLVDYYRERKVLLVETDNGPFAFFSVAGDYNNYSDRSFGEILTESAISIGLTGKQLNKMKWTNSNYNLFIGTAGAEHLIGPQTQSEPFGPDNVRTTIVSNIGGKQLKSQTMINNIVFVDRTGKSIRNMQYDNSSETGNPEDISIFAKHLFRNGVKSWAWQYEPYKVLWCVTQDGKLIGFTFNQEQDVIAFHEHKTNGTFESIASIPSSNGENDELWAVVNRTIDGSTVRYIEYFYNTLTGLSNTIFDGSDDEEDNIDSYFQVNGIYCDSAVKTYNATAFSTVDGLDHLEGEEVVVLGDGMPQTVKTVTDGEITLDSEVNTAIVGLAYSSILQPRAINAGSSSGVSIGKTQRINKLNLQLHKSASFKAGDALDNLQYYSIRKNSSVMGSPVPLFTGFKEIVFNGESEVGPDCFIVSDKPTMLNIVSITYEVSTGD